MQELEVSFKINCSFHEFVATRLSWKHNFLLTFVWEASFNTRQTGSQSDLLQLTKFNSINRPCQCFIFGRLKCIFLDALLMTLWNKLFFVQNGKSLFSTTHLTWMHRMTNLFITTMTDQLGVYSTSYYSWSIIEHLGYCHYICEYCTDYVLFITKVNTLNLKPLFVE